MPTPFLEVFPREIRDQIYTFVLASPSGLVNLSPWTVDVARSLSLLRTCKQIHRECKDIIWLHNGLRLRAPSQVCQKLRTLGKRHHLRRVRQLKFRVEILDRDELEWMRHALTGIEDWLRFGRLECITLVADWERPRGLEEFKEILTLCKYGETLDGRLYQDSSTWTQMVVNTGWPHFAHWGKQRWLKEMLLDPSGIDELLKEIHESVGGELYVNGLLCFREGRQLVETCILNPRNGEVKIIPRRVSSRHTSSNNILR